MLKTIAFAALAAALAFPVAASAQNATGYGTSGPQQGASTFDRSWNASHLSKTYAYQSADAVRLRYATSRRHVYHNN